MQYGKYAPESHRTTEIPFRFLMFDLIFEFSVDFNQLFWYPFF